MCEPSAGTSKRRSQSDEEMRVLSSILSVLAAVTIAGCGGDDPGTGPVADPVSNEQALELISACRVSGVVASHSGEVMIALNDEVDEDGWSREVSVAEPDVDALFAAAEEASDRSCDISIATE
jgi:hypothetical protein